MDEIEKELYWVRARCSTYLDMIDEVMNLNSSIGFESAWDMVKMLLIEQQANMNREITHSLAEQDK